MTHLERVRRQQIVRQAEGYLELEMPEHALATLDQFSPELAPNEAHYLRGEALRMLERYAEAIAPLKRASEEMPSKLYVWLALGWCYKRIGRIDLAIESLEESLEIEPPDAIVYYNLACYWSLAGNKRQALLFLAQAIERDGKYREMVGDEPDFDPIRNDPTFLALTRLIA